MHKGHELVLTILHVLVLDGRSAYMYCVQIHFYISMQVQAMLLRI